MKNYYKTLGISENANEAEIKRAYRSLVVKYHPDKNPAREATVRFTEITEAYDVLSDPKKKFVYDHQWYKFVHQRAPVQEPLQHQRDPRDRPRPKSTAKPEKSGHYILMEKFNRYAYWINVFGLVAVLVFTADFFIPYATTEETIGDYETVYRSSRRGGRSFAHLRLHTLSGDNVKIYNRVGKEGDHILLSVTFFYRTPMEIRHVATDDKTKLAFVYQPHMLVFVAMLLMAGVMGIVQKKNVEQAFSYSVGTVIMLIINWVLVY